MAPPHLWPRTSRLLSELVADRAPDAHVFLSRHGRPFTRFGIRALVQRCADIAATRVPSLAAFCSTSCPPPNPTPMHRTTATASSSSPAARYATARLAAPARCSSPEASNPVTIRPRWRTLRDRPRPCRRQSLPHSSSPAGRLAKLHPRTLTQPGRGPKPPSTPCSGPRSNRSRTGLIRATTPLQSPLNSRQPLPAACQSHPMPIAKPSASGSVQYVLWPPARPTHSSPIRTPSGRTAGQETLFSIPSSEYSPLDCNPPAARRSGPQYNPRLARPRQPRHDEHLCRDRPRDEGEGDRLLRPDRVEAVRTMEGGQRPDGVPAGNLKSISLSGVAASPTVAQ